MLKHSESFDEIPRAFKSDKTFDTFFEGAIRAGYSKEEEEQYVSAMMNQWDIENAKKFACDRAEAKGRAEGKAEGKAEMAKAMKSDGMPIDVIAKYSGLSEVEINSL